jgi:hypothetical protein
VAGRGRSPSEYLEAANDALQGTRGAAMGVAIIDLHSAEVAFAGIGNTAALIVDGNTTRHLVSFGGIIGGRSVHRREFTAVWPSGALFVAHSDGIATRWNLGSYAGLSVRHPSIIAGVLYRDFARGKDDASVLVIKPNGWGPR